MVRRTAKTSTSGPNWVRRCVLTRGRRTITRKAARWARFRFACRSNQTTLETVLESGRRERLERARIERDGTMMISGRCLTGMSMFIFYVVLGVVSLTASSTSVASEVTVASDIIARSETGPLLNQCAPADSGSKRQNIVLVSHFFSHHSRPATRGKSPPPSPAGEFTDNHWQRQS